MAKLRILGCCLIVAAFLIGGCTAEKDAKKTEGAGGAAEEVLDSTRLDAGTSDSMTTDHDSMMMESPADSM